MPDLRDLSQEQNNNWSQPQPAFAAGLPNNYPQRTFGRNWTQPPPPPAYQNNPDYKSDWASAPRAYEQPAPVPHFPMANPPKSRARSYTAPSALQPPSFAAFTSRVNTPHPAVAETPVPTIKCEDTPIAPTADAPYKLQSFLCELNGMASTRESVV